jgi:hypothetical protein
VTPESVRGGMWGSNESEGTKDGKEGKNLDRIGRFHVIRSRSQGSLTKDVGLGTVEVALSRFATVLLPIDMDGDMKLVPTFRCLTAYLVVWI